MSTSLSTAIPLPRDIAPSVPASVIADATVDALRTGLDELEQATFTDDAEASITAASAAADKFLRAHAGVVMMRSRAERRIGELVNSGELDPSVLTRCGITKQRGEIAGQMALVPQEEIDTLLLGTAASAREPGIGGVRAMLPRKQNQPHATINVPEQLPAHVQVHDHDAHYIDDEYHDLIGTARAEALNGMRNPRHAYVYMLHEGITESGERAQRWSLEQIANAMNTSREYVGRLWYEAKAQVDEHEKLALAQLVMELRQLLVAS